MEKRCKVCGELKPLDAFYRMATMKDGHRNDCKACNLEAKAARYRANPEPAIERARRWQSENRERHLDNLRRRRERPEVKARERAGHLRRKFDLTHEQFDAMFAAQDGRCAVCARTPQTGKTLHVDHDHETGAVRGLLCFSCNAALGHLREDVERIGALVHYLDAHDPDVLDLAAKARARLAALRA